ncbi:STM4012 family radical SAM protein [Tenacibaculum jejuense]|uniref:Coproporphyrinogen III oxidase family protein n=1 Tax=Tenacibaculum jejuense TaxID=584609 RepID=A0A238U7F0_9FLAO|nr:STM4012 family radical SAM protein [Tenacibaculum jejuense]SNR14414.1 Coproporphyrinogen III oxidase family protein [Tenacibaculum jejuense]
MLVSNRLDISQPYQGYTYSYPHKSTYRELTPIDLKDVWQEQNAAFFYVHIPFCEMRCGFCNLFTISNPKERVSKYIETVQLQLQQISEVIPNLQLKNFAIGGGTPTFLTVDELESLFKSIVDFGVHPQQFFGSIEASPKTINTEKIELIKEYKIARLSMGIQSWIQDEMKALGRPQTIATTLSAVENIAQSNVEEFNLDLIYGAHNQTQSSFLYSLEKTITYQPTEIFLYPLYIRKLTGLGIKNQKQSQHQFQLYITGRDFLLNNGYVQTSMRCFRRKEAFDCRPEANYSSITDHMIGVGAGARSYTKNLHYSTDYAVNRKEIKTIINDYIDTKDFKSINYGVALNTEEQKRRFLIKSLTDGGDLNTKLYKDIFNVNPFNEFELLNELVERNWLTETHPEIYSLNQEGMCYEDVIGPALYSENSKQLMQNFEWK